MSEVEAAPERNEKQAEPLAGDKGEKVSETSPVQCPKAE